ncbi:MAG: plasmid recombination protein [Erysipelotrichaceae bacterium]|nr:plasmid recombination protein [Erysipelotrichaceae bacterium]
MAHVEKYNRNNITGLAIHYERREGCELSNKEIDKTRTHLNYNLAAQIQPLKPENIFPKD